MRLLVIGYPLPHSDIDNYNPLNAPSYFDYDAVLVDPAAITRVAALLQQEGQEFEAHDGRPVVNAASTATAVSAAEQLRRRADETQRFLETGGLVLVMARPNATQAGVVGFEGCDRYHFLPAPPGLAWGPPYLCAAEGKTVRVTADHHPLAAFLRDFRRHVAYRAVFDDHQPAFRHAAAKVVARGGGDLPVAVEFPVLQGRVVFLPALTDEIGQIRMEMAERLVDLVRQLQRHAPAEEPPYWAASLALPGLEQVEAELEEAEAAAAAASARVAAARERHDHLASYRGLLTGDGPGLATAAAAAFALLGFSRESDAEAPLAVASEGQVAFVETEAGRKEVVEWPYVRLQRRLEERLLQQGDQLKGTVVANGYRLLAPEDRDRQFTDALRVACENYRYCLLTGDTLFALVKRALGGASDAELTGMRRRILAANGLLPTGAALGETEQPASDAGPIF
ncbi:MAG: hypothetical protein IT304_08185 [Dehalococcoidia bacterium]|nr:hypothetical protein [Dehalococcoidia bacterium]